MRVKCLAQEHHTMALARAKTRTAQSGAQPTNHALRPVPNAAPLMCRTKLNTVRLWSDFGATADSDGVLASDLIREGHGNIFR